MIEPSEECRKLAEWLHMQLSSAQNLAWEEGDCCDDCVDLVKAELMPILQRIADQAHADAVAAAAEIADTSENELGVTEQGIMGSRIRSLTRRRAQLGRELEVAKAVQEAISHCGHAIFCNNKIFCLTCREIAIGNAEVARIEAEIAKENPCTSDPT